MRALVLSFVLITSLGLGYDLLTQDFDTTWSVANPPGGWTIFHTGPAVGNDDWHPTDSLLPPWPGHPTRFASLYYDLQADNPPDSLITPVMDCSGYNNVVLSCSTFFARNQNQPYVAQLRYSIDGGATFPYLLRDYRELNVGPELETFALTNATDQSAVVVAWIFDGNAAYITHWSLDDVTISADSIPVWDIECRRIIAPSLVMQPGNVDPQVRFRNNGSNDQFDIPVECRLYDSSMALFHSWSDVLDTLLVGTGEKAKFFVPPFAVTPGLYYIEFWCAADSDYVRSNDTLGRWFRASYSEQLYYDNGLAAGYDDWPVGHYGWGVRYQPTSYPVYLESLKVYLRQSPNPAYNDFQVAVAADNGGVPGEFLYRSRALTATNGWNSVFVASTGDEMVINSGAFHVFYLQVGEPPESPSLGYDNFRSSGASYWQYRAGAFVPDSGSGDYMIRAVINHEALVPTLVDLRTTHVEYPWYEFVQRPFDAPITVQARIENYGQLDASGFAAACSIVGAGNVLRFYEELPLGNLLAGEDTVLAFTDWTPVVGEACSVHVNVRPVLSPTPDSQPANDTKSFGFRVRKGIHTGTSPGGGYAWTDGDTVDGPTYDWVASDSANLIISGGDEFRIYVPIGFNFPYYDTSYTNVYVSTNGWLALGSDPGTNESLPAILPNPSSPNNALYAWWDNLACGPGHGGGKVWYSVLGAIPNRRFVVIWENMNRVGTDTNDLVSFEMILQENGQVIYQYKDVTTGDLDYDNARRAGIGLENDLGSDGLTYLYARQPMSTAVNDLENRVRSGTAIRLSSVFRDVAALEIVEPKGYVFPQQYVPRAKIQNYGTVSDSIRVWMKIKPGYIDSLILPGLGVGDSVTLGFAPWDAAVGTYTAICSTYMVGDVDSTNDIVSTVVIVSPWIQRADIPYGSRRRKVKGACLTYVPTQNKLYGFKGSNDNEMWAYDIPTNEWAIACSMPETPSGRKAKYGVDLAFDPDHGNQGTLWAIKAGGVPDFYRYDIETRIWITCSSAVVNTEGYRPPKKGAALAYVPAGGALDAQVLCLLGNNSNVILAYDINTAAWDVARDARGVQMSVPYGQRAKRCKFGSDMVFVDTALFILKGSNTIESYAARVYGSDDPVVVPLESTHLYADRRGRRKKVKAGASMTYLNGALYLLKGGNQQEFWKYRMDQDSWVQITDIPFALEGKRRKVKRGSALEGVDSTIFCLKGSYGYEFWEYKPSGDTATGALFAARPNRSGVMAESGQPLGLQLSVSPNPTGGPLVVRCNLAHADRTRVAVYDAGGRVVRRIVDAALPPGRHAFRWDGMDEAHRRVPAGVYLLKLETGSTTATQKLVIQR